MNLRMKIGYNFAHVDFLIFIRKISVTFLLEEINRMSNVTFDVIGFYEPIVVLVEVNKTEINYLSLFRSYITFRVGKKIFEIHEQFVSFLMKYKRLR